MDGKGVLTAEGELMLHGLFWRLTLGDKHICLDENFCMLVIYHERDCCLEDARLNMCTDDTLNAKDS